MSMRIRAWSTERVTSEVRSSSMRCVVVDRPHRVPSRDSVPRGRRKVARFTFRNYPDILREAASAAHRERRRMAKREELEGDEDLLPEPTDDTTPEDDDTDGDI